MDMFVTNLLTYVNFLAIFKNVKKPISNKSLGGIALKTAYCKYCPCTTTTYIVLEVSFGHEHSLLVAWKKKKTLNVLINCIQK